MATCISIVDSCGRAKAVDLRPEINFDILYNRPRLISNENELFLGVHNYLNAEVTDEAPH
jgi:hypothetical protein